MPKELAETFFPPLFYSPSPPFQPVLTTHRGAARHRALVGGVNELEGGGLIEETADAKTFGSSGESRSCSPIDGSVRDPPLPSMASISAGYSTHRARPRALHVFEI